MLKKILIAIAVLVVVLAIVVAMQPSEFRIERTAAIAAPPSAVFAQVNDFHHWDAWSPWAKLDPAMKKTYEGAPAGVGAVSTWSGNQDVGEGRATITESRPDELIRIKLEYLRPFEATNTAEFAFKPEGDHTMVTWSLYGSNNFMAKAFGLVMDMDDMLGSQFEQGLESLGSAVTAAAAQP